MIAETQPLTDLLGTLTLRTVRERHFAGAEPGRAVADEGGGGRRVMRRAKRTKSRQPVLRRVPGRRVDARDLAGYQDRVRCWW
jgi:hypothetical protein